MIWVLGSEFVRVLDEREIDTAHISDYLMQAYDGFLDIIEIKRPEGGLRFWADRQDRGNWIPSVDLTKAVSQATRYIYEVEREANSVKFLQRVGNVKTIKPRCVLIFGRSQNWSDDQKEALPDPKRQFSQLDHSNIRSRTGSGHADFGVYRWT